MTRAVFVKQGNVICQKAQAERSRLAKSVNAEVGDATGEEGAESLAEALLAPIKTMTSELGELAPMKGQAAAVEAILTAFEEGVSKIEGEPASPRLAFAFEEADELSQRYGLTECRV